MDRSTEKSYGMRTSFFGLYTVVPLVLVCLTALLPHPLHGELGANCLTTVRGLVDENVDALKVAAPFAGLGINPRSYGSTGVVTVAETGKTLPGRFGGKRIVIKRVGNTWGSHVSVGKNAIQGDPRTFIEFFGVDAARYFGFEMLSETEMTVPDVQEFTGAITRLNRELVASGAEPIRLNFAGKDSGTLSGFLDDWIHGNGLPVSSEFNHWLHDIGIHFPGIGHPSGALRQASGNAHYFNAFLDFLTRKYIKAEGVSKELSDGARSYIQLLKLQLVSISDRNAHALYYIADKRHVEAIAGRQVIPNDFTNMRAMFEALVCLANPVYSGRPLSPRQSVNNLIGGLGDESHPFSYVTRGHERQLAVAKRVLPLANLQNDLAEFTSSYKPGEFGVDPNVPFGTDSMDIEVLRWIKQSQDKRAQIIQHAKRLSEAPPSSP